MKNGFIIVLVTAKDRAQAGRIAQGLLKAKLIACANIINGIGSMFWWQGKIDRSKEALLVLKTKKALFTRLKLKVKSLHTYQNPEIIAVDIQAGAKAYLDWIKESVC